MVYVESKTRSLGQKSSVPSRGQTFNPILMKFCQNVYIDEISDEFENGSGWLLNMVTRSNHRRTFACNQGVVIQIPAL